MTDYRLFEGSYPEVFTALGLKQILDSPYSPTEMDVLKRDLPRSPYFSRQLSVSQIKDRLSKEFHDIPNNRYLQGDLSTGLYELINQQIYSNRLEKNPYYTPPDDSSTILKTCFTDDKNVLCAFSLALQKDETNPGHFLYALTIYKNITALPENRSIVYITSPRLLDDSTLNRGESITSTHSILKKVKQTLQCSTLFKAIAPLIINSLDETSCLLFKNLKSYFMCNENAFPLVQAALSHQTKVQHAMNDNMEKALQLSYWGRTGKYIFQRSIPILLSIALGILIVTQIALPIIAMITTLFVCYVAYTHLKAIDSRLKQEKLLTSYVIDRDIKIQQADNDFQKEISPHLSNESKNGTEQKIFKSPFHRKTKQSLNGSSKNSLGPRPK